MKGEIGHRPLLMVGFVCGSLPAARGELDSNLPSIRGFPVTAALREFQPVPNNVPPDRAPEASTRANTLNRY